MATMAFHLRTKRISPNAVGAAFGRFEQDLDTNARWLRDRPRQRCSVSLRLSACRSRTGH